MGLSYLLCQNSASAMAIQNYRCFGFNQLQRSLFTESTDQYAQSHRSLDAKPPVHRTTTKILLVGHPLCLLSSTIFHHAQTTRAGHLGSPVHISPISRELGRPVYLPNGPWKPGACGGCRIQPNPSKAFQGTWTSATFHPELKNISITFGFRGKPVYVFFINANAQGAGVATLTECDFYVDGAHLSSYRHAPTTSTDLDYNVLAFSTANLPNDNHNLSIIIAGKSYGTYLNFDYAMRRFDDEVATPSSLQLVSSLSPPNSDAPSTFPPGLPSVSHPAQSPALMPDNTSRESPPIGVITGGAISGVAALGILVAVLIVWYRRPSDNPLQGDLLRAKKRSCASAFRASALPLFGWCYSGRENRDRRRETAVESNASRLPSVGPLTPAKAHGLPTSSHPRGTQDIRGWQLNQQIKAAKQELRDLKSEVGHQVPATFRSLPRNDVEVLNAMTEQMRALRQQIAMLQAQRSRAT
ncbi:hypothetical protein BD779DRAFT_1514735 [Infundibulicybe gibba]|nr:hypothetical protein BD779DRAFT_1514735 [Infundibulicybe gibba]